MLNKMNFNLEQISGVSPHVNPESQKASRHNWKEDCHQDVHEEGEKGPGHKNDAHDDNGEHVLEKLTLTALKSHAKFEFLIFFKVYQ